MVAAGVSYHGIVGPYFVPPGAKIESSEYQRILAYYYLPGVHTTMGPSNWHLQQDGAPSHTSKSTSSFFRDHGVQLLEHWPARSPDLSPLDFGLWGILESRLAGKAFENSTALKAALLHEFAAITPEECKNLIAGFRHRLDRCIEAQGGHFEG